MMITPQEGAYPNKKRNARTISVVRVPERGWSEMELLEGELPDSRLTAADRRFVRQLLAVAERRLSDEAMMYLSCGAEYGALHKRAAKEGVDKR